MALLFLLCVWLFTCTGAAGAVVSANGADYQKIVASSKAAVFVAYLAGAPPEDLTTLLGQAQEKLGMYDIKVVTVDCALSSNKKNCAGKVPGSLQLYLDAPTKNPYTGLPFRASPKMFTSTSGGLDLRSIERWVAKNYPNRVELLQTLPTCGTAPTLVLMSEKDSVTMLLKSIAFTFPKLKVLQAHGVPVTLINDKYTPIPKIESLPSLGLCTTSKLTFYSGDLKDRSEIVSWIESIDPLLKEAETGNADVESDEAESKSFSKSSTLLKTIDSSEFSIGTMDEKAAWVIAVASGGASGVGDTGEGWEKLLTICEGVIRPAVVICNTTRSSTTDDAVCNRKLPYVMALPHGSSSRKKIITSPYTGNHIFADMSDQESIKKLVSESLPEEGVQVMPEEGMQEFIGNGNNKGLLSVIVISDKDRGAVAPMLRNLALSLVDYAEVAYITTPSQQFLGNIGNPKLPAVIAMFLMHQQEGGDANAQAQFQVVNYDSKMFGKISFRNLSNFVLQAYSRSPLAAAKMAKESQQSSSTDDSTATGPTQDKLIRITTEAEWNEQCGSSFRGICAMGLLKHEIEGQTTENDETVALTSVMKSIGRSGAAFRFVVVDAECQYGFANRFDAQQENFPAMVAFSPSKGRFAIYKGLFKQEALSEFLNNVVSAKASTIAIPQRPFLSPECDGQLSSFNDPIVEDSESADDFLAEIRAEEARKKAEMKEELQKEEARARAEEEERKKESSSPRKIVRKVKKKKKKGSKKEEL